MENVVFFSPNGKNRTPEVTEALRCAPNGTTLIFEKGTYDFYVDGAYRGYFCPGCNRNGDKDVIFPLLNLRGITIEGGGSEFLFHDRVFPFVLQNCTDVCLNNFSVDFSFPRCLEGTILSIDSNGFLLGLDLENTGCTINEAGNLLIPAGQEILSSSERRFFLIDRDFCCFLSVGPTFYENPNPPAMVVYCDAESRKDGIYFRYRKDSEHAHFQAGKRAVLSHDELRENDVIFLDRCRNTVIRDVKIVHGAGMGLVGQCCENLTLDRYIVAPNEDDLSSTTADAILLTNFTGKVMIENCQVERSLDDAISIHGFYAQAEAVTDCHKCTVRMTHMSQAGTNPFFPGDRLLVSDAKTMDAKGTITVKRSFIRDDPALIFLETEEELPEYLNHDDYIENPDRTPDAEIRGCVFDTFPAIRLGSAGKIVFENNLVKNCHGVIINDLIGYWNASGCVRDVTIRNNIFEHTTGGVSVESGRPKEANIRHKGIRIIGNTFRDCVYGINASCADNLVIRDNIFENVKTEVITTNCNVDI